MKTFSQISKSDMAMKACFMSNAKAREPAKATIHRILRGGAVGGGFNASLYTRSLGDKRSAASK